jgi:hypothetical protein
VIKFDVEDGLAKNRGNQSGKKIFRGIVMVMWGLRRSRAALQGRLGDLNLKG